MRRYFLIIFLLTTAIYHPAEAQDSTYRGTEFWAGYGHHQFMETGGSNGQELVFYLSTLQDPAIVTISIDSCNTPWSRTYNIPANTVIVSDFIPKSGGSDARLYSPPQYFGGTNTASVGTFSRKGINIQSDVPIAVYSHIYGSASSGASLLLPVKTGGYTYQSVNSKQLYASNCFSWVYIIAREDNTIIEIIPSVPTRAQNLTGLQPGMANIITLNKGQIYQVLGDLISGSSNTGFELTGTSIRSLSQGKPIAVFSGSSRTNNPAICGTGGGDNDMVQSFPIHVWGRKYLTAPLAASSSASFMSTNIYKVVVNDPQTVVTRNGSVLTGLLNNSYYIFESNEPAYIVSNKPIMLSQFMTAAGCTAGIGDPDMYYLSPLNAGVKKVNCVRSSKEGISINFVTLIIPTSGLSSLLIDGVASFDHSYNHPSLSGYSVVVKSWPASISQFTIQSDSAFTGVSYGMGNVESYGYNIGANFNPSNGTDRMIPMTWTGSISMDWFNPDNWSTASVPTEIDHVLIPGGTTFTPAISAGLVAHCKSISIENGATINVGTNANLNVEGKE